MRIRELILLAVACRWATILVTQSYLFEPLRDKAQATHPKLGYMTRCGWCAGTWIGIGLALLRGPFKNVATVTFVVGLAIRGTHDLLERYVLARIPASR